MIKVITCPDCHGKGTNDDESDMCPTCDGACVIAKGQIEMMALIKSGFAGVLPTGGIVDRRKHPEAIPIQKNTLLGVPEPKKINSTTDG